MKERTIDLEIRPLVPGLVGLVQGVAQLMGEDADELLGISSAAFCNYVFDPDINRHESERREFSPLASLFSNYGPWSSISYYTGWELHEVSGLSAVDTLKVVVFEIEGGRPMVSLSPALEPTIITGYRLSVEERVVLTEHGEIEVRDEARLQLDHEVFRNWLMYVRPGEPVDWAATRTRQRINVLRWAVEHGQSHQEFFGETGENYATGLRGLRRFRAMLEGLTDPPTIAWAEQYVRAMHTARAAASTCLERWADPIADELESADVRTHLLGASRSYSECARAISDGDNFADAMRDAEVHEIAALQSLGQALQGLPSVFSGD